MTLVSQTDSGAQPVIVDKYLTEDEVELLLKYPTKIQKPSPDNPLMLGAFGYETSAQASKISMDNPVTTLTGDPEDDASILKFTEAVVGVIARMEKFFGIELSITNCNYVVMLQGGEIPVHSDDSFLDGTPYHENEETEYSAIIYLNTSGVDYVGGEISFPLQDIVLSPKTGMLVFFKGDYHLPHGVSKVENGERKTIVLFCGRRGNVSDRPLFSDEHSGVLPKGV